MSDPGPQFDLAKFIDDWSSLFVVMGVFSALAIYVSQIAESSVSEASLIIKTGFVTAFLLSLLVLGLIYAKMKDEFSSLDAFIRAHFRAGNAPLLAFSILIGLLVLAVTNLLLRQEPAIFILILTAAMAVALGVVLRAIYAIGDIVPETPVWWTITVAIVSVSTLVGSIYIRNILLQRFTLRTIYELSLSDPVPILIDLAIILVTTVQSLAAIGVVFSIISIPVFIIDRLRSRGVPSW